MKILGAHVNLADTEEQLEYVAALGSKYIICPGIHVNSHSDAQTTADIFTRIAEKAKGYGLKYGYHNHNNDFQIYDGETVIDAFIKNTDTELVSFELDVGV